MNRAGAIIAEAIIAMGIVLLVGCSEDLEEHATPCEEVVASVDDAQQVRAETFGRGPEGREADRVIAETVTARPDCFPDGEPRPLRGEELLSEADDEGMRRAREDCATGAGIWNPYGPSYGTYDSFQEALDSTEVPLPDGSPVPTEASPEGTIVEYLEDGTFRGLVVLLEGEDGWAVSSVALCGAR